MAYFDPLTNLPNRALLQDRVRQLLAIVRRNREMLAIAYIDLDGQTVQVSASIGIVYYSQLQELVTPEALLRCADQAMYLAKQSGKNQVWVFDSGQAPSEA